MGEGGRQVRTPWGSRRGHLSQEGEGSGSTSMVEESSVSGPRPHDEELKFMHWGPRSGPVGTESSRHNTFPQVW